MFTRRPDTGVTRYDSDRADRLRAKTDAGGRTARFEYGPGGRPRRVRLPDDDVRFDWRRRADENNGPLAAVTTRSGGERRRYTPSARLASVTQVIGDARYTTRYEYDTLGRLARPTPPSARRR